MFTTKKCMLAISLSALPLLGFAEDCCPVIPGEPLEGSQVCPGYFYPAMYELSSCVEFSVSADFLYWAANKQLNAIAFEETVAADSINTGVIIHRAGYRPGFSVGIGIGIPGWDHFVFNAQYLRYDHTTTTTHTAGTGKFLTPLTGVVPGAPNPPTIATRVHSKWHFCLNEAELTVERPFYLGTRLVLSPAFGLKAFWFNERQSIDFDLLNGDLGTQNNHFKSWALGPYLFLDAKALLFCNAYLVAKFGFLAPYQKHTKISSQAVFPALGQNQQDFELGPKKPYVFEPYLESGIGLGWGSYFWCNKFHADIVITYDYNAALFLAYATFGGTFPKDHYWHGLTLKGQFDF